MSGNAAYRQTDDKGAGFLKKLSRWRNSFSEEAGEIRSESSSLLENIHQARREWLNSVSNFDQAENDDMVDYYIYKMKACQVRYNYLLKKAKEMGLRHDSHDCS